MLGHYDSFFVTALMQPLFVDPYTLADCLNTADSLHRSRTTLHHLDASLNTADSLHRSRTTLHHLDASLNTADSLHRSRTTLHHLDDSLDAAAHLSGSTPAPSEAPQTNDYIEMLQYALMTPGRGAPPTSPPLADVRLDHSPGAGEGGRPREQPATRFADGHPDYVAKCVAS